MKLFNVISTFSRGRYFYFVMLLARLRPPLFFFRLLLRNSNRLAFGDVDSSTTVDSSETARANGGLAVPALCGD